MTQNTAAHWNAIYEKKQINEVSWFQENPAISLDLIAKFGLEKSAAIIDIGGGDSLLVDKLLAAGYTNITVLDISERAINKAKKRLGHLSSKVQWMVSDVLEFKAKEKYALWHDRAAFHFITDKNDIAIYLQNAHLATTQKGRLVVGTFSKTGPTKCSGIPIVQYDEKDLSELFEPFFKKQSSMYHKHQTPFETSQDFVFCSFKKKYQ